ncbi:uncharacterized protein LOC131244188 [Magnolia sinica]|uniref:uncharacterized protein LOC131244188 n=1 Tax=Magnolia sinica TaxID=86752 RepID=UPI0026581ACC|nr:uncharacterized protein LOC131244188 [Magnolia sinica]
MTEQLSKELRVSPCSLTFTEDDAHGIQHPHDDALVVTITIANYKVYHILVDIGSSADVIYSEAFKRMGIPKSCLRPVKTPLDSFVEEKVISEGAISLPVTAGKGQHQATLMVDFLVVNVPSVHNVILGRPSLNAMRAVVSTYHLMMKFSTEGRTDPEDLHRTHLWKTWRKYRSMKQIRRRPFNAEQYEAIADEVSILLDAGFIEEVHYPDWISNVVLVKKANEKWWVCVDYSDLNKARLNDSFPLPWIDQLVDSTAGHELLSFLDAYSGYNQIAMHPPDRQKTTFITDKGLYCYRVMPFDLKNAGATYQRPVNQIFTKQIGHIMEVYVDDRLVKSIKASDHLADLRETFTILQEYQMKLNPAKCAFGVGSGKFLGFQVSQRGIEANPSSI